MDDEPGQSLFRQRQMRIDLIGIHSGNADDDREYDHDQSGSDHGPFGTRLGAGTIHGQPPPGIRHITENQDDQQTGQF